MRKYVNRTLMMNNTTFVYLCHINGTLQCVIDIIMFVSNVHDVFIKIYSHVFLADFVILVILIFFSSVIAIC